MSRPLEAAPTFCGALFANDNFRAGPSRSAERRLQILNLLSRDNQSRVSVLLVPFIAMAAGVAGCTQIDAWRDRGTTKGEVEAIIAAAESRDLATFDALTKDVAISIAPPSPGMPIVQKYSTHLFATSDLPNYNKYSWYGGCGLKSVSQHGEVISAWWGCTRLTDSDSRLDFLFKGNRLVQVHFIELDEG